MMQTTAEWCRTFFSGVVTDSWKSVMTPPVTQAEADFIVRELGVAPPSRLLDAPCGNGRLALELARRGYHVTGVDLADYVLEGQDQARAAGLPAVLERRDMRDLPWPGAFDGAFCWGNSFGYLDDAGDAAFVRAVAAALKPGAPFLLNTGVAAECILPTLQERAWYECGNIIMLAQRRYDPGSSRLEIDYGFLRDGALERRHLSQRVYPYRELCALLSGAGFGDFEPHGGLRGEPFRLGCPGLYLVMRRG
jgi:SAM-dependent methyltransferase